MDCTFPELKECQGLSYLLSFFGQNQAKTVELRKTCKRKKDEDKIQSSSDTVSWLIESPTQSTSNTEDEIQRSHIELEKIKRGQTEKEEIQRLQAEQIENERFQMQRELDSLKKEVNKLKNKLEKEPLFNIDDFKDNDADIMFYTGFPNYSTMVLCFNLLKVKEVNLSYVNHQRLNFDIAQNLAQRGSFHSGRSSQ